MADEEVTTEEGSEEAAPVQAAPQARSGLINLPSQPPRWEGDPKRDIASLSSWINQFYERAILEDYFATTVAGSSDFDPSSLPDPANTNLQQAQQTANEAYILANVADQRTRNWIIGTVSVTETDLTVIYTFEEPQPDADYKVILTRASESDPAAGANAIEVVDKTVDDFTVTFDTVPGAGNTVDWDFLVCRGQEPDA